MGADTLSPFRLNGLLIGETPLNLFIFMFIDGDILGTITLRYVTPGAKHAWYLHQQRYMFLLLPSIELLFHLWVHVHFYNESNPRPFFIFNFPRFHIRLTPED